MFLTQQDKDRVSQAIKAVESTSDGELVTVIARASDDYLYIPLLWAALFSLLIPGLLYYMAIGSGWENACPDWGWRLSCDFYELYMIQLLLFMLLALLFRLQPVKLWLVPRKVKQQRAHRHAFEQFYQQGLHETEDRNGILIFVSVAEHYVEIIADQRVSERIEQFRWESIIEQFISAIKSQRVADGFVETVNACGEILRTHFPLTDVDKSRNQLPDHLIEID